MSKKSKYVIQPRGKPLYEDEKYENSFGSRMLAKMGWSKGKGLGAHENGKQDFIRVRYKNDIGGFGYEARDDQWTQNEDGFHALLENLNQSTETKLADVKVASLEEKSKTSRARVHYHKFTRGKDLSRYSAKDLANILGMKTLDEKKEEPAPEVVETDETKEPESGVQIINTGISIVDYFKSKKQMKKKRGEDSGDSGISEPIIKKETPEEKPKKKEVLPEEETAPNPEEETIPEEKPKKKKKKKKAAPEVHDDKSTPNEKTNVEDEKSIPEKSKKKKKKVVEVPENEAVPEEKSIPGTETNPEEPRKKKKKKTAVEAPEVSKEESTPEKPKKKSTEVAEEQEKSTLSEKPKKKKKKDRLPKEEDEDLPKVEKNSIDLTDEDQNPEKKPEKIQTIELPDTPKVRTPKRKRATAIEVSDSDDETVDLTSPVQPPQKQQKLDPLDTALAAVQEDPDDFFMRPIAVEKLKLLHLGKFRNSNVANIVGYGLSPQVKLKMKNSSIVKGIEASKYAVYANVDKAHSKKYHKSLLLKYHKQRNSFKL